MTIEKQGHVFNVRYTRQGKTNQWKAKTTEEQGLKAINAEKVMGLATTRWEDQTKADENHATIFVSVLEEAQIAMPEKANQVADKEFLKRHPGAKIEHSES
jgi:hypothetical protein